MAGTQTADTSRRTGIHVSPKLVTAAVIVVAAVWFIVVNRGRVSIYLWVPKVTAPMWLVLVITYVGGLVTGLLLRRDKKPR
jgi:putative membrane protein